MPLFSDNVLAMVAWPMDVNGDYVTWGSPTKLEPVLVDDYERWLVLPTRAVSCLHILVAKSDANPSNKFGSIFKITGNMIPVLDWNVDKCFANVSEFTLKKMMHHEKVDETLSVSVGENVTYEDALALSLTAALRTTFTEEDARIALNKRRLVDTPEDYGKVKTLVEEDILFDTLLPQDFRTVKEDVGKNDGQKAACKKRKHTQVALVAALFTDYAALIGTGVSAKKVKKLKQLAPPKAAKPPNKAQRLRFPVRIKMDDCDIVQDYAPPSVSIHIDEFNGCFRIKHALYRRKSVSWTNRGKQEAIRKALETAWQLHTDATDEPCLIQDLLDGM
jgi:hypothetical protein